jgi:heptosyltransferase-2
MRNVLILKLGATGDVVRTTPLLRRFKGEVSWVTAEKNLPLLQGLSRAVRAMSWENRRAIADRRYDLVINLEDDNETSAFLGELDFERTYGAYLTAEGDLTYTEDSRPWFDLSLISRFGRAEADRLKFRNRETYQALIFRGLGFTFVGEEYLLPEATVSDLRGDVAISPVAGAVWAMKKWAYYDELKEKLKALGLVVNVLPTRASLLEHLADVAAHRCLVSGDSLPMHLALGLGVKCVSMFTCTSPWEIHEYGVQKKFISPRLGEFFYKRGWDVGATNAISLNEVLEAIESHLGNVDAAREAAMC